MSQTAGVPPAFQSIKSLPPEFKYTNNPNCGNIRLRSTDLIGSNGHENGALVRGVSKEAHNRAGDMDHFDEESPYGGKGESFEDRPSYANEDLASVSLPLPSVSTSSRESRWNDTTPYASKKVILASDCNFTLLMGFEISLLYLCITIIHSYFLLIKGYTFCWLKSLFVGKHKDMRDLAKFLY